MKKSKQMNERVRKMYWAQYIHNKHDFKSFEEFCEKVNRIFINGSKYSNRRCMKARIKQHEIKRKWQKSQSQE